MAEAHCDPQDSFALAVSTTVIVELLVFCLFSDRILKALALLMNYFPIQDTTVACIISSPLEGEKYLIMELFEHGHKSE